MTQLVSAIRTELRPGRLLPSLSVGFIAGGLDIMVQISFALLIFSGSLADHVAVGIGLTLFASCVVSLMVALGSSLPGTVAVPQDGPAVVLALVAAAITAAMPPSATSADTLATVVAAIALTSLLAGVFFLVLGWLKQGGLVRYIPYPVIGGFLAGTGWLLVQGAVGAMTGTPLSLSNLPHLLQGGVLLRWLAGLLFALLLLLLLRRYSHFLILPGMMVLALVLFYLVLALAGLSMAEARADGLLLGPFPQGALWRPLTPAVWQQVHWPAILGQVGNVGTILLLSVVSLLLNASGLELVARRDMDLDRELKATGLANVLAGLGGGGPVGFHALSVSALSYRTGAPSRLIGVFVAILAGLMLFLGTGLLSYLPKVVLGGLLLFLGLAFLVEWLYDAWFKLSRIDYAIVVVIMVAMGVVGVLEGVGLGLALAVVLFVMEYSRIGVVRHVLSGATYQSPVDRPRLYRQLLREKGDWLYILELQGFVFFGTAHRLLDRVRRRAWAGDQPALRFVVLDFRRVSGMDASAVLSLAKMVQLARTQGFVLVFTHLAPKLQQRLEQGALADGQDGAWRIFPDLDHGVEWCEEQMIDTFASVGLAAGPKTVMRQLEAFLARSEQFGGWEAYQSPAGEAAASPEPAAVHDVMAYMECLDVEAGQVLIRQDEPPRGLFFVETGRVTIQLDAGVEPPVRLRTRSAGTIVGEMGLYAGLPASASVVADEAGTIYVLSAASLARMEADAPQMAAAFHRFIAQHLSERLLDTTQALEAILR